MTPRFVTQPEIRRAARACLRKRRGTSAMAAPRPRRRCAATAGRSDALRSSRTCCRRAADRPHATLLGVAALVAHRDRADGWLVLFLPRATSRWLAGPRSRTRCSFSPGRPVGRRRRWPRPRESATDVPALHHGDRAWVADPFSSASRPGDISGGPDGRHASYSGASATSPRAGTHATR